MSKESSSPRHLPSAGSRSSSLSTKIDKQGILPSASNQSVEIVEMFPGWAARRYIIQRQDGRPQVPPPFEVEVFVSGFVSKRRNPENPSRSQRAFVRLAKSFAKFPTNSVSIESPAGQLTQIVEGVGAIDQRQLPQENTKESLAVDILNQGLLQPKEKILGDNSYVTESPPSSSTEDLPLHEDEELQKNEADTPQDITCRRLNNLENRILHLWYSALPNRIVRLHLLVHPHKHRGPNANTDNFSDPEEVLLNPENGHISSQDVTTVADGSFQAKFKVKWKDLCHHPHTRHITLEEEMKDHDLLVVAQLVPSSRIPKLNTILHPPAPSFSIPLVSSPLTALMRTPITHSPIRVISDINDTVKRTGVKSGARTMLSNVFASDFKDNIIPGMAEWYTRMFSRGVRFHYVSNGPFSLLSILNEFFQISHLPPGSLKLRSYSGRLLLEALVSPPATRKRGGVVEILESFPDSKFVLIGDTGEEDMELYAEIARDRHHQILGAFLRDADADDQDIDPIPNPTGLKVLDPSQSESPLVSLLGRFPSYKTSDLNRSKSLPNSGQPNTEVAKPARSTIDAVPISPDTLGRFDPSNGKRQTSNMKPRRIELQTRVYRARSQMPSHIPLRVFREPTECVEVDELLM